MRARRPMRSPKLIRRKREERLRRILLSVVFIVLTVAGGLYAFTLPAFIIENIEIRGTALSTAEIAGFLRQQLSGEYLGIIPRGSIIFYPQDKLEDSLLSRFPELQSARIGLAHMTSLSVALADRQPSALWCVEERCFFMDAGGLLYRETMIDSGGLYRRFRPLATTSTSAVGMNVISPASLTAFLSLASRLELMRLEVKEIVLDFDTATIVLAGGSRLLFRNDGDFAPDVARLETVLAENDLVPRNDGGLLVDYIDLRYGNKIYFR